MNSVENIRGYLFYDAECDFCTGWVARISGILLHRGYHLVPLQLPWARRALGLNDDQPAIEMMLLTGRGQVFGGADAAVQLARRIWWAWPCFVLAMVPGVQPLLRILYRQIAKHRHQLGKTCALRTAHLRTASNATASFYDIP